MRWNSSYRKRSKSRDRDFTLTHKPEFGSDKAEATLYFRRSEQGNYFFNKYDLSIDKDGADPQKQTFYVGKENTFTLKEAYNLMEGRSVNKELTNRDKEAYTSWVKLDFSESDKNGNFKMKHFSNFDLEAALNKLPLKAHGNEQDKQQLMESLQKGNRQAVTIEHNGAEFKRSLEANPQFKTINLYDGNQRVKNQSEKQSQGESQGKSVGEKNTEKPDEPSKKNNAKKAAKDENEDGPPKESQRKTRKKGQGVS